MNCLAVPLGGLDERLAFVGWYYEVTCFPTRGTSERLSRRPIVELNAQFVPSSARVWIAPFVRSRSGLVARRDGDGALSPDGSPPDGGAATADARCAGTPAGHACTDTPDNAPTITPFCAIGTMLSGTARGSRGRGDLPS